MDDRRFNLRQKRLKTAKIIINDTSLIDCVLRNLSETGACLEVPSAATLPKSFRLAVEDKAAQPCRVIWTGPSRLGVVFSDAFA